MIDAIHLRASMGQGGKISKHIAPLSMLLSTAESRRCTTASHQLGRPARSEGCGLPPPRSEAIEKLLPGVLDAPPRLLQSLRNYGIRDCSTLVLQ